MARPTGMNGPRKLYVKSYGCQMNVYDSRRMADTLAPEGFAETAQPEVPFAVDRPIPESLTVSAPLKEVIKLAQAGVGEEVLLTFVENAMSGFHLGADEIIFLTDIGVSGTVINSMMERDKVIKANAAAGAAFVPAPMQPALRPKPWLRHRATFNLRSKLRCRPNRPKQRSPRINLKKRSHPTAPG